MCALALMTGTIPAQTVTWKLKDTSLVGNFHPLIRADDEDRIGQAVDGQLRGAFGAHEAIMIEPAKFA